MIDIEKAVNNKFPEIKDKTGISILYKVLKTLTHEDEINLFIESNQHLRGFSFLDKVLEHFNFTYRISNHSINRIPSEGRLIIIANHPIGSLDGLALLKLISSIRNDVRIVANDLLNQIEPLQSLFLPIDNMSHDELQLKCHKNNYKAMLDCLAKEEALIIFPAGEVSRISPKGIKDGKWKKGFIRLSKKMNTPILPVLIQAKNSALFYGLSTVYKPFGTILLTHEMFNKENHEIAFHVGNPIAYKSAEKLKLNKNDLVKRFRKHLYQLGKKNKKNKHSLFETIETIAHPINRQKLKKALYQSELLGETKDSKKIFLYDYEDDSPVMHEIGRLRELSFRSVEEGTGHSKDLDKFDTYYKHIILWDENDLEIVGAYRLGECLNLIEEKGIDGLYSSTLFDLNPKMASYLPHAIELGRSFVQPRYWGRRSLDYLWFGIGAYLRSRPEIKYMFGPVSLSNAYPEEAKQLIVSFYTQQFGSLQELADAKKPYTISNKYCDLFKGDYKPNYKKLNYFLDALNVKVPTLYKQYSELCNNKGSQFIAFNIDPDFSHCIDGLVLVSLKEIKAKKIARYIG
ncbi:MAG: lysophospholipid acyltransferase family protein [Gammaproteobacteria bacterium]|nr:lysophospholipid acyltransferase family protein [Gammaproteobacteria bacterium]